MPYAVFRYQEDFAKLSETDWQYPVIADG